MKLRTTKSVLALTIVTAMFTAITPVIATEKPLPTMEKPLKPERNPPGDIPDSQVFINYTSPLGFSIAVPEGWAREDRPDGALFADKYGRIALTEQSASSAPKAAAAQSALVTELKKSARAVKVAKVKDVNLPAGPAVLISYGSNSDPNPVTNKAIRLESDRYYFYRNGKLVILDMSAPAGADNVDQWDLMAKSFQWQ
jgi:hypothetical protein